MLHSSTGLSDDGTTSNSTIAPVAETGAVLGPEGAGNEKVWHAGTLTYTRRGLVRLFSWLLWGDFAMSVRDRSLGDVIMVFLKQYGASNTLTAFMRGTLPGLLGMVLGPILSYKSDRHRGRSGRRRPFLFVGVPMAALAIIGMAISPQMGRWLHPILERSVHGWTGNVWEPNYSVLLCFGLFFAVFDVAAVLTGSVFAAFFNDVVPREIGRAHV